MQNAVQGICLDLYNWNSFDGAPVLVWQCTGKRNQERGLEGNEIVSYFSWRCLTVNPTTGPLVVTSQCIGSPNQIWAAG